MSGALQIPLVKRQAVLRRDGERCVRCCRNLRSARASVHHRFARGMGGSRDERINDVRNLVLVCGSGTTGCHEWIHSHPREAEALGWTLRSLDDLDTPMITRYGARVTLLETGGVFVDRRIRP